MNLNLPMPRRLLAGLVLAAMALTAAGQAHVHGEATLEVVIEPTRLSLRLDTPQYNLLGHERAPRNDAERQAAAALRQRLLTGAAWFELPAASGCRLASAEFEAPALLPTSGTAAAAAGHADVVVSYQFDCQSTADLRSLAVGGLFDAFPGLQRFRAQVAGSGGQHQVTVKRPARRLTWDSK